MEADAHCKELLDIIKKNMKNFSHNQDGCNKDLMDRVDSKRNDAL